MNVKQRLCCWMILMLMLQVGLFPSARAEDQSKVVPPPFDLSTNFGQEAATATFGRALTHQEIASDIDYHVIEAHRHTPLNAGIRSAVFPGWGQHFNQQKIKGTLLSVTFAVAAVGSYAMYRQSNDTFNDYEARGRRDSALFDDYESERFVSILLGSAAGFLYGLSIFDAVRNAYQPLWSKNHEIEMAVVPDGHEGFRAGLQWKARFQ